MNYKGIFTMDFPAPSENSEVITIYYKKNCPWSKRALDLLKKNKNILYNAYDIDALILHYSRIHGKVDAVKIVQEKLHDLKPGYNYVPKIFLGNKWLGGYPELQKYLSK